MSKYTSRLATALICISVLFASCTNTKNANNNELKTDNLNTCLLVVGGGPIFKDVLQAFIDKSPKDNPTVLFINYASSNPISGQASSKGNLDMFEQFGINNFESLDTANVSESLEKINRADIIWMPGGSQGKLHRALYAKPGLIEAILERYNSGKTIIGGTSAGASVTSSTMMVNDTDMLPLIGEGLGIWPEVIIDQHFTEWKRLPRLEKAMSVHPSLLGLGIDESTAVLYSNKSEFTVMGAGTVTIFRPVTGGGHEKIVLKDGDGYNLKTDKILWGE